MDQFRRIIHDKNNNNNNNEEEEDPRGGASSSSSAAAFTPPPSISSIISRDSPSSAFSKPILPSSSSLLSPKPHFGSNGASIGSLPDPSPTRYRECLRNHAAALGCHVIDGCGEFMPAGPSDLLRCAACGCHRSFHRKEPDPEPEPDKPSRALLLPPIPPQLTMDQSSGEDIRNNNALVNYANNSNHSNNSYGHLMISKKRFRTKFSGEQKEKMRAFAERVSWRVQKKDEGEMERFCSEIGISRQVLKVWMHNNKHLVKREVKIEGSQQNQNQE